MDRIVSAAVFTSLLALIDSVIGEPFTLDCQLPFESLKKDQQIDHLCAARGDMPLTGGSPQDQAHAHQNLAKNNFCAAGTPALVTFVSFQQLQKKLDKNVQDASKWRRGNLPEDRSVLLNIHETTENVTIGEGTLVTFAGWLKLIKPGEYESCNCDNPHNPALKKHEVTDNHLVMTKEKNASECKSVTIEISPHFRPDKWTVKKLNEAGEKHPLRFTGQLMYDASHRPCPRPPGSTDPPRISSWELHPVYAIDVCTKKSLNSCKANNNSVWNPLDQWTPNQ